MVRAMWWVWLLGLLFLAMYDAIQYVDGHRTVYLFSMVVMLGCAAAWTRWVRL